MAEKKEGQFKTAEEKHKENVVLKCKVCGKKMRGKQTLSRHISHAHNEIDPAKREKIVIDTYFGHDKVERVIRKFKEGEYKNKKLPLDIGKYLRLAEIKPKEEEKPEKHEEDDLEIEPFHYGDKTEKLFVQVRDVSESESHDYREDESVYYVDDLQYSPKKNELRMSVTKGKTSALDYRKILKFIDEEDAFESTLYVSAFGNMYPVVSIDVRKHDEVPKSRIKCVVGYDSTKN